MWDRGDFQYIYSMAIVSSRLPIPDGFWVVWEGPPYRSHSLGDGSECHRGKGLKTVFIAPYGTSDFMVNEGIFLGHKISEQGIEVDKAKVDAIEKMICPKDIKGIRSFLGHAGFYRRFIK